LKYLSLEISLDCLAPLVQDSVAMREASISSFTAGAPALERIPLIASTIRLLIADVSIVRDRYESLALAQEDIE